MNLLSGVRLGVGMGLIAGRRDVHAEQAAGVHAARASRRRARCRRHRIRSCRSDVPSTYAGFSKRKWGAATEAPSTARTQSVRDERLQLYRSCPQGPADGAGGSRPSAPRIRGDRAHPPWPHPRGRGRGRGRAHQPERGPRRDPAEDRGDGQEGQSGRGRRPRPSVHLARQEGARAGHDRSPRAQPLVRRHRAPAARAAARREGHCGAGADRRRREPGAVAGRDAAPARERHAAGVSGRQPGHAAVPRPSRKRSPRRRRSIISAATSRSSPPRASSIRPSAGPRRSSASWRSWRAARRTTRS